MNSDLQEAWALAEAGDVSGLMNHLRSTVDRLAVADTAPLVRRVAELTGFADLAEAAAAVSADPGGSRALYAYGYACVERGASFLAVPALRAALRREPGSPVILRELVTAFEDEYRHGEAVSVLSEHEAVLTPWPDRYLLAYNALMSGDVDRAAVEADGLPFPEDEFWLPARGRLSGMLARAREARALGRLGPRDLRGWHFALTGGVLATLSPFGVDQGMNGRYAYLNDDFGACLYGLRRLRTVLEAAGRTPKTVSLLPGRGDLALGLAASQVLGLPAEPFAPGRTDTVVIAYDLANVGDLVVDLYERAAGQILYEHATCWTEPPQVSADVSTLLCQMLVAPWDEKMYITPDGDMARSPADDREAEELAAEILRATPTPDELPSDTDEELARFVAGIAPMWPADGTRDRVRSAGPVPSSRFR
ncbi:hypothetical protein ACQPZZ_24780 [Microbispora sp. CA-135349]|uniref:hypothetical protein n=1 Tax=Microbispora sp. CA-135349 TaxID=3239953 RepID=UPI003D8E5D40